MTTLLMMLRWALPELVAGIILIAAGAYGLSVYEPIPGDAPFSTPWPYEYAFGAGIVMGALLVLRAYLKGRRLTKG